MNKHSASVVGPDPDGLYWITLEAGEIRASISVRGTGIVGQVMAAFTGQPALVPPTLHARHLLEGIADAEAGNLIPAEELRAKWDARASGAGDLLDTLQRAIDRAEHAPGQWREGFGAGGSIAFGDTLPFDEIGKLAHRRDALLAIAAVNAMPELLERLRRTERGERAADREVERLHGELDTLRMQLAACGVVAMANTPESAAKARDMLPEYRSASCDDVVRVVDREMELRAELERLRSQRSGQAEAWAAVFSTLCEVIPGFAVTEQGTGRDLACAAIRQLAAEAKRLPELYSEADEARIDVIGQNGNDGAVYAELAELAIQQGGKPVDELPDGLTWELAPEWADRLSEAGPLNTLVWHSDKRYRYVMAGTEHPVSSKPGDATYSLSELTLLATRPAAASGRDATQG